jgi:HAD superfamily hydrolase (TIGR01509 family)
VAADAVLFDLDGTLWNSRGWYAELIASATGRGVEECGAELERGVPVARLLRDAGLYATFAQRCRESVGSLDVCDGLASTLTELRARGSSTGIVTSLPRWVYGPLLAVVGLSDSFDTIVGAAFGLPPKPNPAGIRRALDALGVVPGSAAWYVGDTSVDQEAASRAGISFAHAAYYVRNGLRGADAVLWRLEEVLDL